MSYEAVLAQVRSVPEEYLDEISNIISYVMYKHEKEEKSVKKGNLSAFFGALEIRGDPLEIQREMRNEWN